MTAVPVSYSDRAVGRGGFVHRYLREISVAATYVAILVLLAAVRPAFFREGFFPNWVSASAVLVAAVGMTLVILAREIDISIGSQFSICAVAAGLLAKAGMPMPVVALCAIAIGAALGAANGSLVAWLGLPSIVVTLATMVIFRGALQWAVQGKFINDLPDQFQWFGLSQTMGRLLLIGIGAVVLALFAIALRWLAGGRSIYAVGSDREAARLAGIRPKRVIFWVFVLMGALTGLAALMNAVIFPDVDPKSGTGLELEVIAAVVVGGVAISGGRGTLIGALIGVALLTTIGPALAIFHVPTEWGKAVNGLIILLAVTSDALYQRRD